MFKIIGFLSLLLSFTSNPAHALGLTNNSFATSAQIIAAGGTIADLLNDSKIYMNATGTSLSTAITNGTVFSSGTASLYTHLATPANPAAGSSKCYVKADEAFYCLNSAGVETQIGPGGGGGGFPVSDAVFAVQNSVDATKQFFLDLAGATTGTSTTVASSQTANRVITLPDATTTLVGTDTTQTLTNKTIATGANNITSATNSSFAGFDASGNLGSIPNWNFSSDGGSSAYVTRVFPADAGATTSKIYSFETEITNTQANADYSVYGLSFDVHQDRTNNGFNFTGGVNAYNFNDSLEGVADYGQHFGLSFNQSIGQNGAGTSTGTRTWNTSSSIGAGFTSDNHIYDYNSFVNNGTITNSFTMHENDASGSVGLDFNGDRNFSTMTVGRDYYGRILNNSGTVAQNYNADDITNSGAITGDATFSRINSNGTVGGSLTLGNWGNFQQVDTNFTGHSINNSGAVLGNAVLNDYSNSGNVTGSMNMARLFNTGTVGAGLNGLTVNNSGAVTGVERLGEFNSSANVTGAKQGVQISSSGDASDTQLLNIVAGAGTVPGTVQVVNINASGPTNSNRRQALVSNGGGFDVDYTWTSATTLPNAIISSHQLTSNFSVAAGFPITSVGGQTPQFGFGTNLGGTFSWEDDYDPDFTGARLGYSQVGFFAGIAGTAGKTVDMYSLMTGAASITAGTGGTITDANVFRAMGILPNAGVDPTITNFSAMHVDSVFDASLGTNKWGFNNSSNTNNSMAKNLIVGTVDAFPTNASVGIELQSTTKAFLNARMTTAEMNAIASPVAGMQIYNTTASAMYCYTAAWAACGGGVSGSTTGFLNITTRSSNYVTTHDDDVIVAVTDGGAFTITLDYSATISSGSTTKPIKIKVVGTHELYLAASPGDLIDGETVQTLWPKHSAVELIPDGGTNYYVY